MSKTSEHLPIYTQVAFPFRQPFHAGRPEVSYEEALYVRNAFETYTEGLLQKHANAARISDDYTKLRLVRKLNTKIDVTILVNKPLETAGQHEACSVELIAQQVSPPWNYGTRDRVIYEAIGIGVLRADLGSEFAHNKTVKDKLGATAVYAPPNIVELSGTDMIMDHTEQVHANRSLEAEMGINHQPITMDELNGLIEFVNGAKPVRSA